MDISDALASFSALSQRTRLQVFQLLVCAEPQGLAAGEIARQLGVPHNTLSSHLAVLSRARWVAAERHSRFIVYHADLSHMKDTVEFLIHDCCADHPEVCGPPSTCPTICSNKPRRP
ncbi:MAG TPA: metalloregulator ArsR/SmtB family transcription factor [Nevskiaceae bacterium]|nr:metalloregulator ArsR/SmtB family transcription factor [Nevskiaceae bacterium]